MALMLIGMVIDGRGTRTGLETGTATWVLTSVGAAAGGYLGATVGDNRPKLWLLAPTAGVGAGLLIGFVAVGASGDIGGDRTIHKLGIGVAGGLTASVVAAAIYNATHDTGQAAAPAPPRGANVTPGPGRLMISFGGSF